MDLNLLVVGSSEGDAEPVKIMRFQILSCHMQTAEIKKAVSHPGLWLEIDKTIKPTSGI
jgi:hypothetical protein